MSITVAVAQIAVTGDKDANLAKIAAYVEHAARNGARLAVFPEAAMHEFGAPSGPLGPVAETLDGRFVTALSDLARRHTLTIVAGMFERLSHEPPLSAEPAKNARAYNTVVALDERGALRGAYRKIHLYDALGARESDRIAPGDGTTLSFDCDGVSFGVMTCYDLRFPEVARHLSERGADVLVLPAAWYGGMLKESHFRTLARARAIENTVYLCAADQCGPDFSGNSLIVDPMGVVQASLGESEGLLVGELSRERLAQVRAKLPSVRNRRPDVYARWAAEEAVPAAAPQFAGV